MNRFLEVYSGEGLNVDDLDGELNKSRLEEIAKLFADTAVVASLKSGKEMLSGAHYRRSTIQYTLLYWH